MKMMKQIYFVAKGEINSARKVYGSSDLKRRSTRSQRTDATPHSCAKKEQVEYAKN